MIYRDLRALSLTWTKIGTSPFNSSFHGSTVFLPVACIVNGYYSIFYAPTTGSGGASSLGAMLVSFAPNGDMCIYRTTNLIQGSFMRDYADPTQVFQTGNTFVWSTLDGFIWQVIIPNVFTKGTTYVLPINKLNVLNPCSVGAFHQAIFFAQQNLVAYEFIEPFPESDNYYASIYDSLNTFKGAGFIGSGAQDIFDQITTSLPPNSSLFYKNGFNFYISTSLGIYGSNLPILNGRYDQLICGTPTPSVNATSINQSQTNLNTFNIPNFVSTNVQAALGATDYFGFFIQPESNFFTMMSSDYVVRLSNPDSYTSVGYVKAQKKVFCMINNGATNWTGDVYVASLDLNALGIGPLPVTQRSDFSGLANYHRAVSPNGSFQA